MSTAIFLGMPAHGHVNPTLPLVRELVDRRERVIYFNVPEFREKIEANGAEFRAYRVNEELDDFADPRMHEQYVPNPLKLASRLFDVSYQLIRENLQEITEIEPDYFMHDAMCMWGRCVAKICNKRAVATFSTFVFNREVISILPGLLLSLPAMIVGAPQSLLHCLAMGKRMQRDFGVPFNLFGMFNQAEALNVVFTSRYFQPGADSIDDEQYKFVGASVADRKEEHSIDLDRLRGAPVIYISLGTLVNKQVDFYTKCFAAFGQQNVSVVMSIGRQIEPQELGNVPQNFVVTAYAPQLEILKRASLFISHGGMNSVNESLYFGVPLLIVPQSIEEDIIARRLKELGAGLLLGRTKVSPQRLSELAHAILSQDSYAARAREIGETFRAAGGCKKAADAIIEHVRHD